MFFSLSSISPAAPDDQAAIAQEHSHTAHDKTQSQETTQNMPGMQHGATHAEPSNFIDQILHHAIAGTSAQPNSTAEPMIMLYSGMPSRET